VLHILNILRKEQSRCHVWIVQIKQGRGIRTSFPKPPMLSLCSVLLFILGNGPSVAIQRICHAGKINDDTVYHMPLRPNQILLGKSSRDVAFN
jgi:hypothetical protein